MGQKSPIPKSDNPRLLWLTNELSYYIEAIQEIFKARGKRGFNSKTFQALPFTTKFIVKTARMLLRNGVDCVLTRKLNSDRIETIFCKIRFTSGSTDMLAAREVTTALGHIAKSEACIGKTLRTPCVDIEKLSVAVAQSLAEQLKHLTEGSVTPSTSVT
ncbi:hypothetical protein MTO96_008909 [Rhipicephalus appendiculatus]